MIAQSSPHRVGGLRSRGRKLRLKPFKTGAHGEVHYPRSAPGKYESHQRFDILAGPVDPGGVAFRVRLIQGIRGGLVPPLAIALEIQTEPDAITRQALVLIARDDAGVALRQVVAVA